MKLKGVPGGGIWMTFSFLLGLAIMGMTLWFSWASVAVSKSYLPLIPMSFGFLMGLAFTSLGFLSLVCGCVSLTLDRITGIGRYEVRSPVVELGKSCQFELSQIESITLERSVFDGATNQSNPQDNPNVAGQAKFCTASLRITPRRRNIILDETQNGQEIRVTKIARGVADWLKLPLEVTKKTS